ncbi:helix-turn-helix domain-containing protein [Allokutzneria sp. A3M-2-11 16]|uniref:GlxA family transcriptional regulator n=1 Tax=Allokutzneria sp. A3M-2-11 16 TaxID=2962043 RepID=UPI0020B6BE14|nr:helix-turn-helix domain-containing protein [Allokutzneria sp. A3M-2-11 16]MCP3803953.1 helix-turn-helix domain-containing protein [Allokutzneria sp. A3M-2-11 16]
MRTVAVLALHDVVPFDLAMPVDTFGRTFLPGGGNAYDVRVCSEAGAGSEVDTGFYGVRAPWGLEGLSTADTIIVPGRNDATIPLAEPVAEALREALDAGTRIASVCAGAFVLAQAGVLDGLRATTHWLGTAILARQYPEISVDPNVLYVDNGQVLTSAGAAAGLDMCLHMIRNDHGSAVAAGAARTMVMPLERAGGQAQFIVHEPPTPDGATLEPLLRWLEENMTRELSLEDIAVRAAMSARTLNRRFREQTGTTPLQWLHRARLRRAQYLLETTAHPVERIAAEVGFGSTTTFRDRFKRLVGTSPHAYRRAFRGGGEAALAGKAEIAD